MLYKRRGGGRVDHGLEVRIIDNKNSKNVGNGVVQDISMGGIKGISDVLFQVQDKVRLEIKLFSGVVLLID